ncbi:MAG TPA: HEPN domain-containing protein [Vicinamibacterales bacterium]|nr:HEPN domain-containing protein [Vicinamibacterales bacterium]
MTEDNQRRNAADELSRAETCLSEARALHTAALPYGAVSRAYYAVFHAARALLFSVGLEARSHKGIASLVGDHFVRPGRLPSTMGRLVSRMQRDREDADYATGAVFTQEEASKTIADAEAFLEQVRRIIHV